MCWWHESGFCVVTDSKIVKLTFTEFDQFHDLQKVGLPLFIIYKKSRVTLQMIVELLYIHLMHMLRFQEERPVKLRV